MKLSKYFALVALLVIRDPSQAPQTADCLEKLNPIDFITTGKDIIPTPLIYQLNQTAVLHPSGLAVVVFSVALILLFTVGFAIRMISHRQSRVRGLVYIMLTVLLLLCGAWFYQALSGTETILLGFGLPPVAYNLLVGLAVLGIVWVFFTLTLIWQLTVKRRGAWH